MSMSRSTLTSIAEGHIVIGKNRKITVPENLKRIAVQYDHNVETVTFDCPRYWDGVDMSTMKIYINYLCADRTSGTFPATNIFPDTRYVETMHFDWVISKNVTMNTGKIFFQVCIKKTDDDGNEEIHWNSEVCKDCYVTESLTCSDAALNEVYPDMFEQWHREWEEYVNSGELTGPAGVSPTITVTDIEGGHRLTITDVNSTNTIDIMDTAIEADDAVIEMLNGLISLGTSEPSDGPTIWFDTTGTDGESGVLRIKDMDGTIHVFYPVTQADNVNGVMAISKGGTNATTAEDARTNLGAASEDHTHDASTNDITGTLPIIKGGTGATTAADARTNLGVTPANIGAKAEDDIEDMEHGGTGASDGATGLKNLLAAGPTVLSSHQYGTELPDPGTVGRIFFKKVTS